MNERIKKIVKNKYFKIVILMLLWFILRESYAVYVDIYNFRQLEKAKPYLETIIPKSKYSYNIKEFNENYSIYGINIKPIKNCYYIDTYNWTEPYIFWFKLYSYIYKRKYNEEYYIYPESKYNLVWKWLCREYGWVCGADLFFWYFKETISNPCKD